MWRDVVVALIVGGIFLAMLVAAARQWSDGKGIEPQYVPPSMRPMVNRLYKRLGWPRPYDDDLNRIPREDR